jgi:beta-phosphoglucomutase
MNIHSAKELVKYFGSEAMIFDLDGTIIDNNSFHRNAWISYLEKQGRHVSKEEYNRQFNGRTNKDVIEYLFQRKMTDEEVLPFALEKEAIYRNIYQPHIQPVPGLLELLADLQDLNIPMAIATSGIQVNIDFMFEHVPVKKYFSAVINSSHIKKGKPDPEIFIKAAEAMNVIPEKCLVFEDAVVGIDAARSAGMKVIAVSTTHPPDELKEADLVIRDFNDLR